jgi:SAM-dependent methyltransferase
MGHVFTYHDAVAFEQFLRDPSNRFAVDLHCRLMLDMLKPAPEESVLGIGCGTGMSLSPFVELRLQVSGLDPSPYMIDIAKKKFGNRVDFHCDFAEDLPFDDNSFNYACLVTSLEFVQDPKKTIQEACRVAKDRIFIGVFNRYAIKGVQLRLRRMYTKTIFDHARFFSVWELIRIIRTILGDVPISWRTVSQFPAVSGSIADRVEESSLIQRCPFGTFAGIVAATIPRFRTRPLSVTYSAKQTPREVPG